MSITVPPDTDSWVEAQAEGYYGERTDPFPDELYTVVKDVSVSPAVLTGLAPDTCVVTAVPGDVAFIGTGMNDPRVKHAKLVAPDGLNGTGTGILAVTDTTRLTATFPNALFAGAPGVGYGVLMAEDQLTELTARVPFTWTAAPANFGDFNPKSVSLAAAAAGFDLTVTGSFPDAASALVVMIAQPSMGGTELLSTSVTKDSAGQIVGHFANTGAMVVGTAQVIVKTTAESFYPNSGTIDFTA